MERPQTRRGNSEVGQYWEHIEGGEGNGENGGNLPGNGSRPVTRMVITLFGAALSILSLHLIFLSFFDRRLTTRTRNQVDRCRDYPALVVHQRQVTQIQRCRRVSHRGCRIDQDHALALQHLQIPCV